MKNGDNDGISAVQNDSAGRKARLVVKLKRDANANVVLNKLYKNTSLQTTFAVNLLALAGRRPAHLELGASAGRITSRIRSRYSLVVRSSGCARPKPARTSSKVS